VTLDVCCRGPDEDGAHLFLKCREVKKAWQALNIQEARGRMCNFECATAVVQEVLSLPESDRTVTCCMLWCW
jgi:hypothetical protein